MGLDASARKGEGAQPLRLRAWEGERLKEGEGQESQNVVEGRNPDPTYPTDEGTKPLKRGRAGSNALSAGSAFEHHRSERDEPSDSFDEWSSDHQSRGGADMSRLNRLLHAAMVRQSQEGKSS